MIFVNGYYLPRIRFVADLFLFVCCLLLVKRVVVGSFVRSSFHRLSLAALTQLVLVFVGGVRSFVPTNPRPWVLFVCVSLTNCFLDHRPAHRVLICLLLSLWQRRMNDGDAWA